MSNTFRVKSKICLNNRIKPANKHKKKKEIDSNRYEKNSAIDSMKLLQEKSWNGVNLQIPSANSLSTSIKKSGVSATLKGYKSRLMNSQKELKSRKKIKPVLDLHEVCEVKDKVEKNCEFKLSKNMKLDLELKKALEENKVLKKMIQEENSNDFLLDEMMKSFNYRLYKLLYD